MTLDQARRRGDAQAVREVEALRPFPDRGPFTIEQMDGWRKWANRYGALAAYREDANFYLRAPRLSPEYTAADRQAWSEGAQFTVQTLVPRMANISFRNVRRMRTPVVMMLGRHDYATPSSITEAWMTGLRAPRSQVIWFEHSAHLPMIEEPGRVMHALVDQVRPLASRE